MKSADFELCLSIDYADCPFYKPIIIKGNCKYYNKCKVEFKSDDVDFIKVKKFAKNFCANPNNRINCARYKLYKKGNQVPEGMLADGTVSIVKVEKYLY